MSHRTNLTRTEIARDLLAAMLPGTPGELDRLKLARLAVDLTDQLIWELERKERPEDRCS